MIGLGVAGLGWLGESLIKDVPRVPGLHVVAVQDVRLDRAQAVGEAYEAGWAGSSFEDLLAQPDVAAVLICTPNALHSSQAQEALRAGKDVLVQKPLALSFADAQATIQTGQTAGRLLFVDYSYRFLETVQAFWSCVQQRSDVQSVRAVFHNIYGPGADKAWFFDARLSGGGALMDLGVHLLDLALWLFRPARVELSSVRLTPSAAFDVEAAAALTVLLGDLPFDLEVSWKSPLAATEISFEVRTASSVVRWENVDGSFFRFRTVCDGRVLADRETTLREDTLRAFATALQSGTAPPIDPRVYALLDRAYGRADRSA